ncbi:MAG: uracil-DNA glycosylase [Acidobacteriota bacterium]
MNVKESFVTIGVAHEVSMEDEKSLRRLCMSCKHYFVTWDPSAPHGCRAMGFKGAQIPSVVVYQSSGMECQLFDPKKGAK